MPLPLQLSCNNRMTEGHIIGTFQTQSGTPVLIRAISHTDTAATLQYFNTISAEDTFLLVSGEQFTHEHEERYVAQSVEHLVAGNKVHLLAFIGDTLVGNCEATRTMEYRKRALHVAQMGLSVDREFRDDGIGRLLMEKTIEEARKMPGIRLLRLWVFGTNEKAKKLYMSLGFEKVGAIPGGILFHNQYIDYDLMCLKLREE